jgi:UDP-N-acetylmuramoyl-tripeptide--D-alanyl-D-alanine ligase
MRLTLSQVAEFISSPAPAAQGTQIAGYSIDSRTIQPGELFFAVKGERLDGHDFVREALDRGAAGAVVRLDRLSEFALARGVLGVDDPISALQQLASKVRTLWGKTLVGITGSTGKTTTKEAIASVLSHRFRLLKTEGNFNNHFGLPLILLRLEPAHEIAVVEIGMSHAGEIAALARIAQPNIGVVTNVGPVHLEFFDSVAGIARAKYELVENLSPTGTAVLNADDEYVSQFGNNYPGRVITYGFHPGAQIRGEHVHSLGAKGSAFDLIAHGQRLSAEVPLVGDHNIANALAAIAVGLDRGMNVTEVVEAVGRLSSLDKRGQVVRLGNITVINDCYNSNPKAMAAMVDALVSMPARRRIVVAGEMLELGSTGAELHRACGEYIARKGIDVLVGVRGLATSMVDAALKAGMRAEFVASAEEAAQWLERETRDGDLVLLKASRGVKLEQALERWQRSVGAGSSHAL